MVELSDLSIGQTVEVHDGKHAIVRFIGKTQFAPGDWLGVELEDNSGKNDGSVQGQRYFDCPPAHGMFCRPAAVTVVAQPKAAPAKRVSVAGPGAATRSRPTSTTAPAPAATKRQSLLDTTSKRRSINAASPTPAAKAAAPSRTLRSPAKSPTKQLGARTTAPTTSRTSTSVSVKPSLAASKRTSLAGRPSLAGPSATTKQPASSSRTSIGTNSASSRMSIGGPKPPTGRVSTLQRGLRTGSVSARNNNNGEHAAPSGDQDQDTELDNGEQDKISPDSGPREPQSRSSRPTASNAATNRELEDLKTKLKVMEKKRLEDREKLKNVEQLQGERDKFEAIIQKLQAKMQPQQQEISELRRQLKEAESSAEASEDQKADFDLAMESAFVDKEMAEERYEVCKGELDILHDRYEELKLEAEILREENSELGKEMSPEERTSQGWLQMERTNERLREALLRLRDMTQETEAELKDQIAELQEDNTKLTNSEERYEDASQQLKANEDIIENLKQQLDGALGSEEMIEELTEKNSSLTEKIDELRLAIEDLESLKELNDELELNHMENEKQLQDELDYQESLLMESVKKFNAQEETVADLEYTISRFRELVGNLQSEIEELRASQQFTENEASELSSKTKAMMDMNLRLQASASKAQNRAIEMELGKLNAEQASDHLAIVQHFLPDSYAIDKDSVSAYLRIKRIWFKANLLCGFVKERLGGVAIPGQEEDVFAACVVLDELIWMSEMCQRFVRFVSRCSLESFKRIEGALYDLDPVERALNGWIDGLKRGELREQQCASELKRSIAVMEHLAEVHIPEGLVWFADDIHMRAVVMQSRLENAANAIIQMKQVSQAKVILPTDADEEDEANAEQFLSKADSVVTSVRSIKVIAGKAVFQLEELQSRSLTLVPSTLPTVEQAEKAIADLATACQSSATALLEVLNEEGREASLTYDDVAKAISPGEASVFGQLSSQSTAISVHVQNLHSVTTSLFQTVEFSSPAAVAPWELLAQSLKAEASAYALHEKEVLRLKDELAEKNTAVAIKDKSIEELNVNIEVLSKRVNESTGRKERLKELEVGIEASRSKELETTARFATLQQDFNALEAEREKWAQQAAAQAGAALANSGDAAERAGSGVAVVSKASKAEQEMAAFKLKRINSSLQQVRQSLHRAPASVVSMQLSQSVTPAKITARGRNLAAEAAEDVYRSLSHTMLSADFKPLRLATLNRDQRLMWRPSHESPRWQAEQQKMQYGVWREVHDRVPKAGKAALADKTNAAANRTAARTAEDVLAKIRVAMPGKSWMQPKEVEVVQAEEWHSVERQLGVV